MHRLPIAPFAAATLVLGWAVVAATGSRPLGGVVLLVCGSGLVLAASARRGRSAGARLAVAGVAAFIASHLLALLTGAWPAVLVSAAVLGAYARVALDARRGIAREHAAALGR